MAAGKTFLVVATLAATLTLLGNPAGAGALEGATTRSVDWPQFHGQPSHQGFNRAETRVGADNVSRLSPSWRGYGGGVDDDLVGGSSPAVVGGFEYFGTLGGQLLAFRNHCRSGLCRPAWRVDLGRSIQGSPAVVGGILYVGTNWLYAFDVEACAAAGTCHWLWRAKVDAGQSSPTVSHGVVYVGSFHRGVYAYAADGCGAATCDPLWVGRTAGRVRTSPAVSQGVVYAGDDTGYLYAFDANGCGQVASDGAAARCHAGWRGKAANAIFGSSPAVHGGFVYTASFGPTGQSFLEVFDAAGCGRSTCGPTWRGTGGHYLNSAPAVAYGNVYIGSGDGLLLVFPAMGCGHPRCGISWYGRAAGSVGAMDSAPMVANGVVYAGEDNATVRAYPARGCGQLQCDKLWEFRTDDPVVDSSPVMVNGTLFLSGTSYSTVPELYVFELPDQ